MIEYEDLDIKIEPQRDGQYPINVLKSPAGEGQSILKLTPESIERTWSSLRGITRGDGLRRKRGVVREENKLSPFDVGHLLFEALFTGNVLSLFDQSLGMVRSKNAGLRIKLHMDLDDDSLAPLARLPWELLYRQGTRNFLNLSRSTPIVRYLELQQPPRGTSIQLPLRVLVILAKPQGSVPLDLERERAVIEESWARQSGVEVDFIEHATIEGLQAQLTSKPYHILHYMGHGGFDERTGQGMLHLEGHDGEIVPLDGSTLSVLLQDEPSIRLIVLNACETATGTGEESLDPFSGMAHATVMAGVPAVVAMQFPISDRAAITFASRFYLLLSQGYPVDAAVAEARKAIRIAQPETMEWCTPVLFMRSPDGHIFDIEATKTQRSRIFISYKRDVDPDEKIALELKRVLSEDNDVFIDQIMAVGTPWIQRIEEELSQSDYLIILLSEHSVHSEMVRAELETASRLAKKGNGRPIVLPVRLNYREAFQYPLNEHLDHINWAFLQDEEDTPRLISELEVAIAGGDLSIDVTAHNGVLRTTEPSPIPTPFVQAQPPPRLETPEGTMDPHSVFYVERPGDQIALRAIEREGVTITIKGPRQIGKSSLLIRTMSAATQAQKQVAFLDFQLFDDLALKDANTFYKQFCMWLTDELDMDDRVEEYWQRPLGNSQRCTRYMGRYLLKELGSPLLLAMDEVESVFDAPFRNDFFSMLRSWHNKRASNSLWRQLDLALVTSTEPYQLIADLNQSPFNVGEIIEVADFSDDQIKELNARHGSPLRPSEIEQLFGLLRGHPYLTRRALYLTASKRITLNSLIQTAIDDRGPFGDHLRYHLFRLHRQQTLTRAFQQVLERERCEDAALFWRLRGAGLVRRVDDRVVPRCKLYRDYFRRRLNA